MVPLIFEAGGRPAEETMAFVCSWATDLSGAERSKVIRSNGTVLCCSLVMLR